MDKGLTEKVQVNERYSQRIAFFTIAHVSFKYTLMKH